MNACCLLCYGMCIQVLMMRDIATFVSLDAYTRAQALQQPLQEMARMVRAGCCCRVLLYTAIEQIILLYSFLSRTGRNAPAAP
jgi:hypothetical protein